MAELLRPVPHRNLRGHADPLQFLTLERPHIGNCRGRLAMKLEIDERRGNEFHGRKALVEFARGDESLQQIVGQRLPRPVVSSKLPQYLRLLLPVLVKL